MVWDYDHLGEHIPDLSVLRRCWPEYSQAGRTRVVEVRGARFGGENPIIVGGPCSVDSRQQMTAIARAVKASGGHFLRGGAYKPRSNPHTYKGLGREGLEILAEVSKETGLGFVTEVLDPRLVEEVASFADMIQIGARSMYNYPLLTEVGKAGKPVLLKRSFCATIDEWLCAAEYIAVEGNRNIVLCERGIRTPNHWNYARGILDLNILEPVRHLTPLPIIVDPSHATGVASLVPAMSRAALAAGAHGLLVEIIAPGMRRTELQCDAMQAVSADEFRSIVDFARRLFETAGSDSKAERPVKAVRTA